MRGASRQKDRLLRISLSFAGLVVLARSLNPIPSRTRPLNSSAPMVLWLKPWESRSLPGLPRTRKFPLSRVTNMSKRRLPPGGGVFYCPGGAIFGHDGTPYSCRRFRFMAGSFQNPYADLPYKLKLPSPEGDSHASVHPPRRVEYCLSRSLVRPPRTRRRAGAEQDG